MSEADLVQFTGGGDVSPDYYLRLPHPQTYPSPVRDREERMAFIQALAYGKKMAGICRGAQLLNVLMGGQLWQHCQGHGYGDHMCYTQDGEEFIVNSIHHQIMIPTDAAVLIGWAKEKGRLEAIDREGNLIVQEEAETEQEAEILFYPQPGLFCFQGHPEYDYEGHIADRYIGMVKQYLFA